MFRTSIVLCGGTNVEWPREKNVPTVAGFCPAATRRRVIRSMALNAVQSAEEELREAAVLIYGLRPRHGEGRMYRQERRSKQGPWQFQQSSIKKGSEVRPTVDNAASHVNSVSHHKTCALSDQYDAGRNPDQHIDDYKGHDDGNGSKRHRIKAAGVAMIRLRRRSEPFGCVPYPHDVPKMLITVTGTGAAFGKIRGLGLQPSQAPPLHKYDKCDISTHEIKQS